MNPLTGIITAPRPIPTLDRAVASMIAAGFLPPLLAHDNARLGNIQNFSALAAVMLASDQDYFLICEDDVTWIDGASSLLELNLHKVPCEDFGVLSLHCTRRVSRALEKLNPFSKGNLPLGVYESLLGRYTWGACALLFSRTSLRTLIDSSTFQSLVRTHRTGLDGAIFGTLKELNLRAWYLLPCLARHDLGEHNSGILTGAPHEARGCDY